MNTLPMSHPDKLRRLAWFLPLALLVYAANAWLVRSPPAHLVAPGALAPEWPVLFDLLLMVPLLYLIAFRRDRRRALTGAVALAVAGVMIAGWIVPLASQHWLGILQTGRNLLIAAFVVGEIALAVGLARLTLKLLRVGNDPERAIASALHARFGDSAVARLLAFEVRMWFYALFASARRKLVYAGDEHFTCHAKDGHASNQHGFILLILIELPIVHVLLSLFWTATAAWIVSAFSLWGLAFLLGEHRATLRRPVSLDAEHLHVRYGLCAELAVPLDRISAVSPHGERVSRRSPGTLRYCDAGVPNVCITLDPVLDVPGLFGDTRPVARIYLGVDAPARLLGSIRARIAAK